jgi:hypothetical protein
LPRIGAFRLISNNQGVLMNGKSRMASLAAAAAMTGLLGGAGAALVGCHHDNDKAGTSMEKMSSAHDCKGMNACKGQGGCKTTDHDCKGKNSCKGQGGCKVS